jgi:hypothetical protein
MPSELLLLRGGGSGGGAGLWGIVVGRLDEDGAGGGGREAGLALSVLSVARSCVMSAVFRRIELHEKAENPVRQLAWEPVMRPKLFAYLLLNGTQIFGLFRVLGPCEFCEFKPFLRHLQKMRAEIGIRRFLR